MPEIGPTLREARMRAKIDISEIEAQTKIRAKYLRALENEEWDLLPGPTYVKTFLRTYAEALGLDAKLIVEEYKVRHERLSEADLQPISPRSAQRARERRPPPRRGFPRGILLALLVIGLVGALYALGSCDKDDEGDPSSPTTTTGTSTQRKSSSSQTAAERKREREQRAARRRAAAARRPVSLQFLPQAPVTVCLVNINGDRLLSNETLAAGNPSQRFRSKRFRMLLSSGQTTLRVNGRTRQIPAAATAGGGTIALEVTRRNGVRPLTANRPTCVA